MNTDRPPHGIPEEIQTPVRHTLQTENGLGFQHSVWWEKAADVGQEPESPSYNFVAEALMGEMSVPGAYDLMLAMQASYAAAAAMLFPEMSDTVQ